MLESVAAFMHVLGSAPMPIARLLNIKSQHSVAEGTALQQSDSDSHKQTLRHNIHHVMLIIPPLLLLTAVGGLKPYHRE